MSDGVTYQAIKRISYIPDRPTEYEGGTLIGGQDYWDIFFSGGEISNVTITDATIVTPIFSAPVPLEYGGTGAALADPGADRILFWDDSEGVADWLIPGSGLVITDKTITVAGVGLGDVTGPMSSIDKSVPRFQGTTGKILQGSAMVVQDDGSLTVTSSGYASFAVGPNGFTNAVLQVSSIEASQDTGVLITGRASGTAPTIEPISSASNCGLTLGTKGTGVLTLSSGSGGVTTNATGNITDQYNSVTVYQVSSSGSRAAYSLATSSTAAGARLLFTGAADTLLTAGTEAPNIYFNMGQTRQHASNTIIANQRDFRISPTTHSFETATGTITKASTVCIDGPPVAGTNASITNAYSLEVVTGNVAISTITSGSWNGTAIGPTYGGTGQTSYATGDLIYASGANTLAKRTVGATGQVLVTSGGVPTWGNIPLLHLQHKVASGTNSGTTGNTTWNTRPINTEVVDEIGSTLSTNTFTLPAGTYEISVSASVYADVGNMLRLYNTSDSAAVVYGVGYQNRSTTATNSMSSLFGRFTIAGTKTFRIEHYTVSGIANTGFGLAVTSGADEIYCDVQVRKIG